MASPTKNRGAIAIGIALAGGVLILILASVSNMLLEQRARFLTREVRESQFAGPVEAVLSRVIGDLRLAFFSHCPPPVMSPAILSPLDALSRAVPPSFTAANPKTYWKGECGFLVQAGIKPVNCAGPNTPLFFAPESNPKAWIEPATGYLGTITCPGSTSVTQGAIYKLHITFQACTEPVANRMLPAPGNATTDVAWPQACPNNKLRPIEQIVYLNTASLPFQTLQ